jgi:hypothetical protein
VTNEEITTEMAKLDGLERYGFPHKEDDGSISNREGWTRRENGNNKLVEVPCPPYLDSSDACISVIKKLTYLEQCRVARYLSPSIKWSGEGISYNVSIRELITAITSTPRRICVGILRSKSKWTD